MVSRARWLVGAALVKFTVGMVTLARDLWLSAVVKILLPRVAVGPPALVPLERPKRATLLRRDHEIAAP